ncbi:hypothetical protein K469DRAFT_690935 [Zopfia rhizophila CBS 207.26]|uniref:Uncharacterized protein n=1 Tax=Zopfia rhizophila CBS 207.26 TaxID=1314779 RepID=A0A6A6EPW5_9PEZI|nr:hypothetical protein K469DRAFT_690935 [Zopfia rhizophila CBS 207.26]
MAKRKNSTAGSDAPAKKNPTRQARGQRASRLQSKALKAPSTKKIVASRAGGTKKPGGPANCLRVRFVPTREEEQEVEQEAEQELPGHNSNLTPAGSTELLGPQTPHQSPPTRHESSPALPSSPPAAVAYELQQSIQIYINGKREYGKPMAGINQSIV